MKDGCCVLFAVLRGFCGGKMKDPEACPLARPASVTANMRTGNDYYA
jgi:hypothetical protein